MTTRKSFPAGTGKLRRNRPAFVALELIGSVIAGLALQAVIQFLFDRDEEPLWGLFRGLVSNVTAQVVVTFVVGLVGVGLAVGGHVGKRPTA